MLVHYCCTAGYNRCPFTSSLQYRAINNDGILKPRGEHNMMRHLLSAVSLFSSTILPRSALGFVLPVSFPRRLRSVSRLLTLSTRFYSIPSVITSHQSSEFVQHVIIEAPSSSVHAEDIVQVVLDERKRRSETVTELSAKELLHLGAVWFLPAGAPKDPSQGVKPERLLVSRLLQTDDYLRIHHHPRRFPAVYDYDWSTTGSATGSTVRNSNSNKPGVIVGNDDSKGWLVIDKPPLVPVHMTVDNRMENVAACILAVRTKSRDDDSNNSCTDDIYVSTPQRLDQNTSGLLVVATSKPFANYFAKLLAYKTEQQLATNASMTADESESAIHKLYKCLVCIQAPTEDSQDQMPWSVQGAYQHLQSLKGQVVRHYLEPSIRAPKRFVETPPVVTDAAWPECLLRIRNVGSICALIGNTPGKKLSEALWQAEDALPDHCQAVAEVEIELLTGRTHQIRGQLAAMGYPLVGDAQYGGAKPIDMVYGIYATYPKLALQCCQLEFLDPDITVKEDGDLLLTRSKRWNSFRLDSAWWSSAMDVFTNAQQNILGEDATTSIHDVAPSVVHPAQSSSDKPPRRDLLPPRIQLSPGKNKYVLIKATHPDETQEEWFVKSASPSECGGPYHANVAQDLREWIVAAGYKVFVTGGGRIDYRPELKKAVVYGFSYGFGKGDHVKAAKLINEFIGDIEATYDYSDELY